MNTTSPVIYMEEVTRAFCTKGTPEESVKLYLDYINSDDFRELFKKHFPCYSVEEAFGMVYAEYQKYGKVLDRTDFVCISGNDGDLKYPCQCQECGTIVVDDHSYDAMSVGYELTCPTCNNVEDNFVFPFHKIGSFQWIISMRISKLIADNNNFDGWVAGDYDKCKFKLTWKHTIKFWTRVWLIKFMPKKLIKKLNWK